MTTRLPRYLMAIAAVLLAVATGLGAWASHGLDSRLDPDALAAFETAVSYQFIHALGIFAIGGYASANRASRLLLAAATLIFVGTILFSGGVYSSSLDGPRFVSAVAPTGGVSLIAGWLAVAVALLRR